MSTGSRSIIVFEGVLQHLNQTDSQSTENIRDLFNAVVDVAVTCSTEMLSLGWKDNKSVETFLSEHKHNLDNFTALCNIWSIETSHAMKNYIIM